MEILLYGLVLGIAAALIVPLFYGVVGRWVPTSVGQHIVVPTAYPKTAAGIFWSIVVWGLFLGLAIWLVSLVPPLGKAVREEA
jgi:hypothetical protein